MRFRLILVALATATTAACGAGSSGGSTAQPSTSQRSSAPAAPTVSMSIADGSTLAEAVPWQVTATAASSDSVASVDFLVDGKTLWTEHESPYVFDDDQQVLPPWLLGAGDHVLTAHVRTAAGGAADATAHVTVHVDLGSATRLAGTYRRVVTATDQRRVVPYRVESKGAFGDVPPAGPWTLRIMGDGEIVGVDPSGDQANPFVEPFTVHGSTLTLYGPAVWRQPDPTTPSLFCEPEMPSDYTWSLSGTSLTIATKQHACADRDTVFVGTWTKDS